MRDDLPSQQLPTINPGQIWVVEHDPALPLAALDRDALINANAVIYDRALAPLVALVLPMGGYAEPSSLAVPENAGAALPDGDGIGSSVTVGGLVSTTKVTGALHPDAFK